MTLVTKRDEGKLIWRDEGGMLRGNNAAHRIDSAEAQFNAAMAQAVAVAEQTPAKVQATPAPKVELREFTFRYWTKSDGQGHQDILAENREQALSVLWMLDGDYIDKVWAD